ncbi:MAG: LLM class flavin-dependent oxidoreductase [Undibacterium sp.]|nr:LLM class flavin-dependent oxidoreductase [Undibacterium sp.]
MSAKSMQSIDNCQTLIEVLQCHALQQAKQNAYVFLQAHGEKEQRISYQKLHDSAKNIAMQLKRQDCQIGDRVLLLFPSGLEFITAFWACLYVGAIAVPTYPPVRSSSVLDGIVKDCSPKFVLATEEIKKRVNAKFATSELCTRPTWLVLDFDDVISPHESLPVVPASAIAMLQYTSGSTGAPKGVMLSHANLMANLSQIQHQFGINKETVTVGWLPLYHDMGLIGNVLGTLYGGGQLYFMSPQDFVQEPLRWLAAISRYKASISGGPNFAYKLCADRISPSELEQLDLSTWKIAFNGAEPVRASVIEQFSEKFYTCHFDRSAFQPCYGMAESSLLVSVCKIDSIPLVRHISKRSLEDNRIVSAARASEDGTSIVSCGHIIDHHVARIVDHQTRQLCGPNQVGEIWIRGASVCGGYWNQDELNQRVFAQLADTSEDSTSDRQHYLRTGDLGFFSDGHLFITGRLKDVIIIRGRNYYPQDIEQIAAESHEDLRIDANAAFEIEVDGSSKLVIVQEVKRTSLKAFDPIIASDAIRKSITLHFQLQVHRIIFIQPQHLPKTSSGKVQRSKIKNMVLANELEAIACYQEHAKDNQFDQADKNSLAYLSEDTPLERDLREAIAKIIDIYPATLKMDLPLIEQGIDSLKQLELSHKFESTYQRTFTIEHFFDGLTVKDIARQIEDQTLHHTALKNISTVNIHMQKQEQKGEQKQVPLHASTSVNPLLISKNVSSAPPAFELNFDGGMQFSMMFFSSDAEERQQHKYDLLLSSVEFGDKNGFQAIWIPERHFHRFGGLYPNPAVLAAAVAVKTSKIRIRAGSVILPLHDPLRVAEEWSVVDNLSHGRVDLAFGQGWNPNDFVLAPQNYASRLPTMYQGITDIKALWRGEKIARSNGLGEVAAIGIFPPPQQTQLATWITCSGGPDRFAEAGASGANVLTALLFQDADELAVKILAYRRARAEHGHNPHTGQVTLMLHTFVGEDLEGTVARVRDPMLKYLEDSVDLWRQKSDKLENLSSEQKAQVLEFALQRYLRSQSLCGTPETCLPMVQKLHAIGVNEIACLLDFGVPSESVMASLWSLKRLKDNARQLSVIPSNVNNVNTVNG